MVFRRMSSNVHTLGPHYSWVKVTSSCCSRSSGKLVQMILLNIAVSAALMLGEPDRYSLGRAFGISLPAWVELLGLVGVILAVLYTEIGVDGPPSERQEEEAPPREEGPRTRRARAFRAVGRDGAPFVKPLWCARARRLALLQVEKHREGGD